MFTPVYLHETYTPAPSRGISPAAAEGKNDLAVFSPSLMVLFSEAEPNCPLQGAFRLLGAEDRTAPPR